MWIFLHIHVNVFSCNITHTYTCIYIVYICTYAHALIFPSLSLSLFLFAGVAVVCSNHSNRTFHQKQHAFEACLPNPYTHMNNDLMKRTWKGNICFELG